MYGCTPAYSASEAKVRDLGWGYRNGPLHSCHGVACCPSLQSQNKLILCYSAASGCYEWGSWFPTVTKFLHRSSLEHGRFIWVGGLRILSIMAWWRERAVLQVSEAGVFWLTSGRIQRQTSDRKCLPIPATHILH